MTVQPSNSPAARQADIARDVVEEVLLELRTLSRRVDRTAISNDLHMALASLGSLRTSALDDPNHLDVLTKATDDVRRAGDTLIGHSVSERSKRMRDRLFGVARALEHVREATIDEIVATQEDSIADELRVRAAERVPQVEPFAISLGLPHLHTLERETLKAKVDVDPEDFTYDEDDEAPEIDDPDDDTTAEDPSIGMRMLFVEDDDANEARSDTSASKRLDLLVTMGAGVEPTMVPGVDGELAMLRRLVRTCLEDISANENLRTLKERERYLWDAQRGFEGRMLASIDALVALGQPFFMSGGMGSRFEGLDILHEALEYGRDAVTIDPFRAFSRTLALTSIAGTDTVRAAVLGLKQSHPYSYAAQARAFGLSPNPEVDRAMTTLARGDDPRLIEVALDALYLRGVPDTAVIMPLLDHARESIRARAARALGSAAETEATTEVLIDLIDTEVEDEVTAAVAEALVYLGSSRGVEVIRERLAEAVEQQGSLPQDVTTRFMQLLGVAGKIEDAPLLMQAYTGGPGEARALGFHGHAASVETLLDALRGARGQVITGTEGVREAALAILRVTGAPIHKPNNHFDFYDVVVDYPTIAAWWEDNRERFELDLRYRFGVPWSGLTVLDELERDNVPLGLRRLCAIEIGMLLREHPIVVESFAVHQASRIREQRASLEACIADGDARYAAGRWIVLRK
jgi:HEAT repeats